MSDSAVRQSEPATESPANEAPAVTHDESTTTDDVPEEAPTKDNAHDPPSTIGSDSEHDSDDESEEGEVNERSEKGTSANPEEAPENPPLPSEPPPDDGWQPVWDANVYRYYFYNTITGETTWTNPRVPEATDVAPIPFDTESELSPATSGYNPAIHGDYDPTAPYAQPQEDEYTAVARFNRFTGKFQAPDSKLVPENYNDENKSRRQLNFYFDADAAANSHDGRSLKAERQTKKLTKKELKEFKAKRKEKKEQKRRAWLKD